MTAERPSPSRRRRRRLLLTALVTASALLILLVVRLHDPLGPDDADDPSADGGQQSSPPSGLTAGLATYPFGDSSVWRLDVSRAPIGQESTEWVEKLAGQVAARYDGVAAFNTADYSASMLTVPPGQTTTDVAFHDCQGKGYQPSVLVGDGGAFKDVPLPSTAAPATGNDGHFVLWDPAADALWEFWRLERSNDGGWAACWGGKLEEASSARGYFAERTGATATGLSLAGGTITIDELTSGSIEHAMAMSVDDAAIYRDYSWPAQRSDGADRSENAIPEGARFRLPAEVDVEALNLSPVAEMIARAAQKYGFIVVDKGGSVAVKAESAAMRQALGQSNPWPDLLDGRSTTKALKGFPWEELEALPRDYGKPEQ